MKTAAIVTCNDSYDYHTRTKYVCDFLVKTGYKVTFLISDFDHRNKVFYNAKRSDAIEYIHVRPYKKNISLTRILSHLDYANGVKEKILNSEFDLVYHCAPPNSTIKVLSEIKNTKKFELVTEIGDMWPETLPVSNIIKTILVIPLTFWKNLRNKYLFNSNYIIAECDLFKNQLIKHTKLQNIETMYFCKQSDFVEINDRKFDQDKQIVFCYLGSINNIIDIDIIGLIINKLVNDRKVIVHIIGDGEKKDKLLNAIENNGGQAIFHGKIFSEKEKKNIFSKCDYSLNIMKKSVNVGMTMKSLDYFSFGIPIINNIDGDICEIVENESIGFNVSKDNIDFVINKIKTMDYNSYNCMVKHVQNTHDKYFSIERFNQKMKKILDI